MSVKLVLWFGLFAVIKETCLSPSTSTIKKLDGCQIPIFKLALPTELWQLWRFFFYRVVSVVK
jgi:hypothetical protein